MQRKKVFFIITIVLAIIVSMMPSRAMAAGNSATGKGIVYLGGVSFYDTSSPEGNQYVVNILREYYGSNVSESVYSNLRSYFSFSKCMRIIDVKYPTNESMLDYIPCKFIDSLAYWDCMNYNLDLAVYDFKASSEYADRFAWSNPNLSDYKRNMLNIMDNTHRLYDYYGYVFPLNGSELSPKIKDTYYLSDSFLSKFIASAGNSSGQNNFQMYLEIYEEYCNNIWKYDVGAKSPEFALCNFIVNGKHEPIWKEEQVREASKILSTRYPGISPIGSKLSDFDDLVYASPAPSKDNIVGNGTDEGITGVSGIFKIVLNLLGAVVYLIANAVNWILNMLSSSLDAIIFGRVAVAGGTNGVFMRDSSGKFLYTSLFQFGTEPGNVYGTIASNIFIVLKNYSYIMMAVAALAMYVRSFLKVDAPRDVMSEGGAGERSLSIIKNIVLCFAALAAMPVVLNVLLKVRDYGLYYMTGDLFDRLTGNSNVSLINHFHPASLSGTDIEKYKWTKDPDLFMHSILWALALGGTLKFLLQYVGYALNGLILVATFPFVCVRAMLSGTGSLRTWFTSMFTVLVYPLIDSIIFMIPLSFCRVAEEQGADVFYLIAVLSLLMFGAMRDTVFKILGLSAYASNLGGAAENAGMGMIKTAVGAAAAVAGAAGIGAKANKKDGGGAQANNATGTNSNSNGILGGGADTGNGGADSNNNGGGTGPNNPYSPRDGGGGNPALPALAPSETSSSAPDFDSYAPPGPSSPMDEGFEYEDESALSASYDGTTNEFLDVYGNGASYDNSIVPSEWSVRPIPDGADGFAPLPDNSTPQDNVSEANSNSFEFSDMNADERYARDFFNAATHSELSEKKDFGPDSEEPYGFNKGVVVDENGEPILGVNGEEFSYEKFDTSGFIDRGKKRIANDIDYARTKVLNSKLVVNVEKAAKDKYRSFVDNQAARGRDVQKAVDVAKGAIKASKPFVSTMAKAGSRFAVGSAKVIGKTGGYIAGSALGAMTGNAGALGKFAGESVWDSNNYKKFNENLGKVKSGINTLNDIDADNRKRVLETLENYRQKKSSQSTSSFNGYTDTPETNDFSGQKVLEGK